MPKSTPITPPLDREAKRRLAVIRHVEEVSGNVAMSCRYFGISRQAYYTCYRRYQAEGIEGLRTRSKAPETSPNATHVEVVGRIRWSPRPRGWSPGAVRPIRSLSVVTAADATASEQLVVGRHRGQWPGVRRKVVQLPLVPEMSWSFSFVQVTRQPV
ncbi:leucine zipper domain-containing protein [Streptomyces sp. FXJ1.172]|nr:leucine zipper domain-containing protein [Streptomyces sp. FXJ1.172]WEO93229.1 helix-turn-helix domain-containing protein [Streptomyces sp. FXJ1.172]